MGIENENENVNVNCKCEMGIANEDLKRENENVKM